MKRLLNLLILFVLLSSSLVIAQSGIGSLTVGESKIFTFGSVEYKVELLEFKDKNVRFSLNGENTGLIGATETHKFPNGVVLSVVDFFETAGSDAVPRVKYLIEVPTVSCGTTRCHPGERCVDLEHCYTGGECVTKKGCETYCGNGICEKTELGICEEDCSFCGDGICSSTENCGDCESDCACDIGAECVADVCKNKVLIEEPIEELPVISEESTQEQSLWKKLLSWLKFTFLK